MAALAPEYAAPIIHRLERMGADVLPDPWAIVGRKARGDGWSFDQDSQRWRYPNSGRAVPEPELRRLLAARQEAVKASMQDNARQLVAGKINAAEFEIRMRAAVKESHLQARLLAVGGKGNATERDFGAVGQRVRREYRYLSEFSALAGKGGLSEAQLVHRSGMYAGASVRDSYVAGRVRSHMDAGYTHKRRTGPNDDGTCTTCRTEIGGGWVAIDAPGWQIGHSECLANCRCNIEFKRG
jgi:hypothetical protein